MTLLLLLRLSKSSGSAPVPVVHDGGIYVANKYDPFPRIRKRKKGKFLTTQEIEDNKWAKKKEEEDFLLLFTDDYDD